MRAENFPKVANINGILMGATPHRDGILMAATLAANENKVAATLMPLVPTVSGRTRSSGGEMSSVSSAASRPFGCLPINWRIDVHRLLRDRVLRAARKRDSRTYRRGGLEESLSEDGEMEET